MIERHIIKLNLYSKGYCLYIKEKNIFEENEINVVNEKVPQAFILIQKKIERILFSNKLPVSLSFNYDVLREKLLIGFGILLNIPDDKGREGIVYIHCVELSDTNHLFSIVLQIIKSLSISNINNIYQKNLRKIANENIDILSSLKLLCSQVDDYKYISPNYIKNASSNTIYSKIIHDCSGGASIAWLTFSFYLNNNKNNNWEVFDYIEKDGTISTTLNPINKINVTTASELLIVFQENNIFSNLSNSKINTEEDSKNYDDNKFYTDIGKIASKSETPELISDNIPIELTNEIETNLKTGEIYLNPNDKNDKLPKRKIGFIVKVMNINWNILLFIIILFTFFMSLDSFIMYKFNHELSTLKSKIYQDSIKIELLRTNNHTNSKPEMQTKTSSNHTSEIVGGRDFIREILTSIDGKGKQLTKIELQKALNHYVKIDTIMSRRITYLFNSFEKFDSDKNLKLDSLEIMKALYVGFVKLEDIIKSKHSQYVKTSYSESNCFTDADLEKFRNNKIPNQIVADLMKNNAFIDLIISIKGISPTDRQELLERCSKIAKLTWANLGKVSPNGQTEAGNQAELLISEAIVNKIQSMMSLSVEEIKKKYK